MGDLAGAIDDEQTFRNRSSRQDRPKSFAEVRDRGVGLDYIGLFDTIENSQKFDLLLWKHILRERVNSPFELL